MNYYSTFNDWLFNHIYTDTDSVNTEPKNTLPEIWIEPTSVTIVSEEPL